MRRFLSTASRSECFLALLSFLSTVVGGSPASGASRDEIVSALGSIPATDTSLGLRAATDSSGPALTIGEPLRYRFESERDAYLVVIHVDSVGVASVFHPSGLGSSRVTAGRPTSFPEAGEGVLQVSPPMGPEDLFVFASPDPVTPDDLQLRTSDGPIAVYDLGEAPTLIDLLQSRLSTIGSARISRVRLQHEVRGRPEVHYVAEDVVVYMEERRRAGIREPKLPLYVNFETGSAELTAPAQRNLDEISTALLDPRLSGNLWMIAGHTDDRGADEFNLGLSRDRATSVAAYLRERGVTRDRLDERALGEKQPMMAGTSDEARRMNRRVELQLLQER